MSNSGDRGHLRYEGKFWSLRTIVEVDHAKARFITERFGNRWINECALHELRPSFATTVDGHYKELILRWGSATLVLSAVLSVSTTQEPRFFFALVAALSAVAIIYALLIGECTCQTVTADDHSTYSYVVSPESVEEHQEFRRAFERRVRQASGDFLSTVALVHRYRRVLVPQEHREPYLDWVESTAEHERFSMLGEITAIGMSPDRRFLEHWSFTSRQMAATAEEWLAETDRGKAFCKQWEQFATDISEFEQFERV